MTDPAREQKMAAARARLEELASKFLERTACDLQDMRAHLARLEAGESAALDDLRHLAHRMVGTGATLGFESLSEGAARIEALADECGAGAAPAADLLQRLAQAVDGLADSFHQQRDAQLTVRATRASTSS